MHADFTDLQVPDGLGHGFLVSSTEIVFRGRCAECRPPSGDTSLGSPRIVHHPKETCHRMPDLKGSKTQDNLKEAFAGESQANRRYLYFAQKADVEGYPDVAALFRSVAEGETGHAFGHFDFLAEVGDPVTDVPVGPTADNLKSAIAGETYEYTEMYPGFAKTARDEGFEEIAEWLETLARAEKSHAGRFTRRPREPLLNPAVSPLRPRSALRRHWGSGRAPVTIDRGAPMSARSSPSTTSPTCAPTNASGRSSAATSSP